MSVADTAQGLAGMAEVAAGTGARRRRLRLLPYLLLAPSLVFLALFTYLPIVRVAIESLYETPHGTGAGTTFVGLANFGRVLADPAFRQAAINNLVYAIGTLLPSLVL